ncbi:MAG: UDP-2,4-diacetamido-2,4,6-trideoxy-beta-L-altropyranose hydrolase [Fibrobacteria bacterium]
MGASTAAAPMARKLDIAFRVDASARMGTGHMARCLCLADAFAQRGDRIRFVTREFDPSVCEQVARHGHTVLRLPAPYPAHPAQPPGDPRDPFPGTIPDLGDGQESWLGVPWDRDAEETLLALGGEPVDLLVADNYGLDHRWETRIRPVARRIMALDDGGDRVHDCDLLLDQNLHGTGQPGHARRVPEACRLLLGPGFALLRPEFRIPDAEIPLRDGGLRNILVCFGGSDPGDETGKALAGLALLENPALRITVVAGALYPRMDALEKLRESWRGLVVHRQVDFMARLMAESDLAIGAGGTTTWERCRMGLPALVTILADNQAEIALAVAAVGAQRTLGWSRALAPEAYAEAIRNLDGTALGAMSRAGRTLVDGKGCERVMRMAAES